MRVLYTLARQPVSLQTCSVLLDPAFIISVCHFIPYFMVCKCIMYTLSLFPWCVCVLQPKAKGVEGLIEISNPNRVANKSKKASEIDVNAKVELSRREK